MNIVIFLRGAAQLLNFMSVICNQKGDIVFGWVITVTPVGDILECG